MKLEIKEYCIRCGLCEDLYPELFHFDWDKDEIVILYEEIPESLIDTAKSAMRDCAIAAIHISAAE